MDDLGQVGEWGGFPDHAKKMVFCGITELF